MQHYLRLLITGVRQAWPDTQLVSAHSDPGWLVQIFGERLPDGTAEVEHNEPIEKGQAVKRKRGIRRDDYRRRLDIWDAIALTWNKSHNYERCRELLRQKFPHLLRKSKNGMTISYRLLRDIVDQGERDLLKKLN